MNEKIKKILEDVYAFSPELKEKEVELILAIEKLLESKPDMEVDGDFIKSLKSELLKEFSKEEKSIISNINFNFMNKFVYVLGGVVFAILVTAPSVYYLAKKDAGISDLEFAMAPEIQNVEKNAFGSLSYDVSRAARPEGGGGGGGGVSAVMSVESVSKLSPIYRPVVYEYKYVGEDFILNDTELPVLKKIKGSGVSSQAVNVLKSVTLGLIDLSGLSDLKISNFALYQDKERGYEVYVNPQEGNISINRYWQGWQSTIPHCQTQECYESIRIKASDIPKNEEIIRIADNFLASFGIDMENYEKGSVEDEWRVYYENEADKENFYFPDVISVMYPFLLDGKAVYDQGGRVSGMRASVDIRTKLAAGLHDLSTNNYQSSLYDTETDVKKVLNLAENGGIRYYPYYKNQNSEIKVIEISTPKFAYFKMWQQKPDGTGEEILAPAMVFPVIKSEDAYMLSQSIIVPLAKDILKKYEGIGDNVPSPRPIEPPMAMPLEESVSSMPLMEVK